LCRIPSMHGQRHGQPPPGEHGRECRTFTFRRHH
jgi:hypothetical protein